MRVTVSHRGGMNFEAAAGDKRAMLSDADGDGARPMETVLMGLGGCSGIDVLSMLNKSRQRVAAFDIDIEAERADGVPGVFTRIHLRYQLRGESPGTLDRNKVMRAVTLSMEKYCSVTRMLEKSATMTYAVNIDGEDIAVDNGGDNGDGGDSTAPAT